MKNRFIRNKLVVPCVPQRFVVLAAEHRNESEEGHPRHLACQGYRLQLLDG